MSSTNKYGLTRSSLSETVKRQIRKNSGFGCVKCGLAVGEYEHVDPEFNEALEHTPANMTYLCGRHHDLVTLGRVAKSTVKEWMKRPAALQAGFSFEQFDIGPNRPTIVLGNITAIRPHVLIEYRDVPIFWIDEPEEPGGPFRLNADFRNRSGHVVFSIRNNEWRARTDNWDVESKGPRTIIRNGSRDIALTIRTDPPNQLTVERMDMRVDGLSFKFDGRHFFIQIPEGDRIYSDGGTFVGCKCVIGFGGKDGGGFGRGCESMEVALNFNPDKPPPRLSRNKRPDIQSPTLALTGAASAVKVRGVLWDKIEQLRADDRKRRKS